MEQLFSLVRSENLETIFFSGSVTELVIEFVIL